MLLNSLTASVLLFNSMTRPSHGFTHQCLELTRNRVLSYKMAFLDFSIRSHIVICYENLMRPSPGITDRNHIFSKPCTMSSLIVQQGFCRQQSNKQLNDSLTLINFTQSLQYLIDGNTLVSSWWLFFPRLLCLSTRSSYSTCIDWFLLVPE